MAGKRKKNTPTRRASSLPPKRLKDSGDVGQADPPQPLPDTSNLPAIPSPNTPPVKMPRTYSPGSMQALCEAIAGGLSKNQSLTLLGLTRSFQTWRKAAKQFIDQLVGIAETQFIAENIAKIRKASNKSWQASAWLLERRFPSQYSAGRSASGKGITTGPVNIVIMSAVPRPYPIMRRRGKMPGESSIPPDEVEAEQQGLQEVIDVAATVVKTAVPRRELPKGGEEE